VEDNPGDVTLIKEMLRKAPQQDFQLINVETLSQALEQLRSETFHAALMDLGLPDSQGLDTFLKLRDQAPDMPVVVLTGHADENLGIKAVRKGAQDYLVKGMADGRLLARSLNYAMERKRGEMALRQSEEKFRTVFESASDAIFMLDQEGRFLEANQATCERFGKSREQILQLKVSDLLAPESTGRAAGQPLDASKLGHRVYQTIQGLQDGQPITVEVSNRHIDYDGHPAILGIARDISERRRISLAKLQKALDGTVQAVAKTVEMKDPYTAGHQRRVAELACAIALEMGLDLERIDGIRVAATIHDIGKVAIPAELLTKPTKLSALEYNLMKTHAEAGYEILKDIEFPWPVAQIVLQHHERVDGTGYPRGLQGQEILQEARIVAVADVVEVMASHRPYRPALGMSAALQEISKNKGAFYDPEAAAACLSLILEKGFSFPD